MNWQSISPILRIGLLLGAVCYLALILWLLKKKKLTVRYSIIWLISAGVLLVFAVFPYVVLVLTDLPGMAVPSERGIPPCHRVHPALATLEPFRHRLRLRRKRSSALRRQTSLRKTRPRGAGKRAARGAG
ncbi:MAG: DUF2304 family protein [Ruthenibacterium lactatiformans]